MANVLFQIVGVFVLAYTSIFLLACLFVPRASALLTSPPDYGRLIAVVAVGAVLGIGVLHLRKWAAIALSLLLLYPAFWCVYSAVHPSTGGADWLGFLFAILLIGPAILTAFGWRTLTWRKKSEAH
jgi:hypothetical protein